MVTGRRRKRRSIADGKVDRDIVEAENDDVYSKAFNVFALGD